jgi:hypothetical protein
LKGHIEKLDSYVHPAHPVGPSHGFLYSGVEDAGEEEGMGGIRTSGKRLSTMASNKGMSWGRNFGRLLSFIALIHTTSSDRPRFDRLSCPHHHQDRLHPPPPEDMVVLLRGLL